MKAHSRTFTLRKLPLFLVPVLALAQVPHRPATHKSASRSSKPAAHARAAAGAQSLTSPAVTRRVNELMSKLTFSQKVQLLSGYESMFTHPIPAQDLPAIKMSDASVGVRVWGPSTAYPASVALAATWDPALAYRAGRSVGRDARARGVNIVLGPGMDLTREPQCGRNFEYLGEDPTLAGRMAVAWVRGIQSQGVAACSKHYAGNEQETNRMTVNTIIGKRALEELYLAPFRDVIEEGHSMTIMPAYNKLNGLYCTASPYLLDTMLRQHWGFEGVAMSDWGAVHDTLGPLNAGLDLEMPGDRYFNRKAIDPLLSSGDLTVDTIDQHVRRLLRVMVAMGWLDRPQKIASIPLNDPTSAATALQEEREAIVLLKNKNGVLPLNRSRLHTIVVVGPNATPAITGGGGSSFTTPIVKPVSMLQAIRRAAGAGVKVIDLPYPLSLTPPHMWPPSPNQAPATLPPFTSQQTAEIRNADAVIACVGPRESEGVDRPFNMPGQQNQYLHEVGSLNPRTIVVVNAGSNVGMSPWIHQVSGLLYAWYPGENGNTAVADALFGRLNPSGKLPDSFEKHWKDAAAYGNYPGKNDTVNFKEGIYMGYRWFDSKHIAPRFPFGFGLSYTTFAIRHMSVADHGQGAGRVIDVNADVTNTGKRAGAEVVQLYVRPLNSSVERTFQQLRDFARVQLAPGQTRRVHLRLPWQAFAYYNTGHSDWEVPAGSYTLALGSSSRDIAATKNVSWTSTLKQPEFRPQFAEHATVTPPPSALLRSALHGAWRITQTTVGNQTSSTCNFDLDGNNLSGSCTGPTGQKQSIKGTASGDTATWVAHVHFGRRDLLLLYKAQAQSANSMKGTLQIPAYDVKGTFTGSRQ